MSAQHACNHTGPHHHDAAGLSSAKIGAAVLLTLAFVIAEAIAGTIGHSLALLSDAGHNFADAAALGFSWYAIWMAKKPSNESMTFGYHRVGILAALVNAVSLVVIALFIIIEAAERLRHPESTDGKLMIVVAAFAIVINVVIGVWLHAGAKDNLNIRAAYIHMAGDAISALGVVIAGVIVATTHAPIVDPIVSFLIAGLILWSSWGVLKESVSVLLEGTPHGIEMPAVVAAIRSVAGVREAHDLHVWTVGPGAIACCVHVVVAEQSIRDGHQILRGVSDALERDFKINHATVQIEVEGHCPDEMYCSIETAEQHVGHFH